MRGERPFRLKLIDRGGVRRLAVLFGVGAAGAAVAWAAMLRMPGQSHVGAPPPLTGREAETRDALRRDVETLAVEIGERNLERPEALARAADWLASSLALGGRTPSRQRYWVGKAPYENVELEIAARAGGPSPPEIVVVGAHYDSAPGSPGADDNASGVAAMLALARSFAGRPHARALRFVGFANEEPPYFQSEHMGSLVYARRCRERGERVAAMLSLETMGYYAGDAGTQRYPFPVSIVYPSRGDFLGFVGDYGSRALAREAIAAFRGAATLPSEGAALPADMPGVGWSDHWSFWQVGYPAVMVTDTAPFRYPHYHTSADLPRALNYERLARAVTGLERVVERLVEPRVGAR
jgi:peptidase M28-like protein